MDPLSAYFDLPWPRLIPMLVSWCLFAGGFIVALLTWRKHPAISLIVAVVMTALLLNAVLTRWYSLEEERLMYEGDMAFLEITRLRWLLQLLGSGALIPLMLAVVAGRRTSPAPSASAPASLSPSCPRTESPMPGFILPWWWDDSPHYLMALLAIVLAMRPSFRRAWKTPARLLLSAGIIHAIVIYSSHHMEKAGTALHTQFQIRRELSADLVALAWPLASLVPFVFLLWAIFTHRHPASPLNHKS